MSELEDKSKVKNNKYLENAHHIMEFIQDEINNKDKVRLTDISEFLVWIFRRVKLTNIICANLETSIRIFNVLNTRGIPLGAIDILKSSLVGTLASNEDKNSFVNDWNNMDTKLKEHNHNMSEMVRVYYHYKTAAHQNATFYKDLLAHFKNNENSRSSLKIVYEMAEFSQTYIDLLKENNSYTHSLKHLKGDMGVY